MGKLSWVNDLAKGAAKNLDEVAQAAAKQADELRRIKVHHGTPHRFPAERLVEMPDGSRQWLVGGVDQLPDIPEGAVAVKDAPLGRFRMEKMGTGEGAQAYGHGLYTAESKGTAQWYRDNLTDDKNIELDAWDNDLGYGALDSNGEIKWFSSEKEAKDFKREKLGALYTAEIPDGDYLLWDKPLSEQPEAVKKVWADHWADKPWDGMFKNEDGSLDEDFSGKDVYEELAKANRKTGSAFSSRGEVEASAQLKALGIPGIKYLDGSSRSAGEGAYNYVLFDDDLVDIKERGMVDPRLLAPLAAGAAGAGALMSSQDSQAGIGDDIVKGALRGADDAAQAAAKQLDMSTAARMQRAAEQRFDTGRVLYRGEAKDGRLASGGAKASPVRVVRDSSREPVYLTPDPNLASRFARLQGENPAIYPVLIKGKIWDFKDPEHRKVLNSFAENNYDDPSDAMRQISRGNFNFIEDPEALDAIKDAGFAGFLTKEIEGNVENYGVFDESSIRSTNAAFDPKNIGKNDLLGAATIGGMATAGAVGAGLMGAQAYDFGTPDYDAKIQEFRNRRAAKSQIWKEMKEAGATIASAIPAGLVSDAYRIGGYLSPVTTLDETEQGAESVQNALMYTPEGDNRYLNEFARQMQQFEQDVQPMVNAWKQTPIYKGYKKLPERAQRLIQTASEYAF